MKRALLAAAILLAPAGPARAARALILGDSHAVGPFGGALEEGLRAKGYDTALDAVCGASSTWWLGPKRAKLSICWSLHDYGGRNAPRNGAPASPPPSAADLLAAAPDLVVFALGSNAEGSAAQTANAAGRLLLAMPRGTRCVWVGPPPMPKRLTAIDEFYKELAKTVIAVNPPCALIDSRNLISAADAAPNDHFYGAPAVAWGRAAAAQIAP